MPHQPLEASVRLQPGLSIIDLHGDIHALAEKTLNAAYHQAAAANPAVLLNFSRVEYINSTGLALIVNLLIQARRSGHRLLACGLKDHFIRTFEITRLTDFIQIFPDEPGAIKSLQVLG